MPRPKDHNRILQEAVDNYTTVIDYNSGTNPIYIGKALVGSSKADAVWQIQKITYDGNSNPTDVQWANSDDAFVNIWNNRASLPYS